MRIQLLGSCLLAAAAIGLCGCPTRFSVSVAVRDKDLQDKSVEVHIVGVNESENRQWSEYSMTKYWSPGDELRAATVRNGYAKVMKFGQGLPTEQTLTTKDDIWPQKWENKRSSCLYVLAFLPGAFSDKPGDADARRRILPLDPKAWDFGRDKIQIELHAGGLTLLTPPKVKR